MSVLPESDKYYKEISIWRVGDGASALMQSLWFVVNL